MNKSKSDSANRWPPLPKPEDTPLYLVLVDDNPEFLKQKELEWRTQYPDCFHLITLDANTENIILWINNRLASNEPLDTVFLDVNMNTPNGSGIQLLQKLRRKGTKSRYLPIAMMTAVDKVVDVAYKQAFKSGAQGFFYKHNVFLYEAAMRVQTMWAAIREEMWGNLSAHLATWAAEAQGMGHVESGQYICNRIADFLKCYFGIVACYIREEEKPGVYQLLSNEHDDLDLGEILGSDETPFIKQIISPDGMPQIFRRSSLEAAELGTVKRKLMGYRLIAAPIVHGEQRIGWIKLYRDSKAEDFKQHNDRLLLNLAYQLGTVLAPRHIQRDLRRWQTELGQFISNLSDHADKEPVIKSLVNQLHKDINKGNSNHGKTSIRLLDLGTGNVPRLEWARKGYTTHKLENDGEIATHPSYDMAIKDGKTIRLADVQQAAKQGKYKLRADHIQSSMTIPLLAYGVPLGAVNMEHRQKDFYTQGDEDYAKVLSQIATTTLARIRTNDFLLGMLKLINNLEKEQDPLPEAFKLLYHYVGYAHLLHLVRDPSANQGWRLTHLYLPQGQKASENELCKWQEHIYNNWEKSYFSRVVHKSGNHSLHYANYNQNDNLSEILDDVQMGTRTRAQAVLFIGDMTYPTSAITLLFVNRPALSNFQKKILEPFGLFVSELLHQREAVKQLKNAKAIAEKEAEIGIMLGDFRHATITKLFNINSMVKEFFGLGKDEPVNKIKDQLWRLEEEVKKTQAWMREPNIENLDAAALYEELRKDLQPMAEQRNISIHEFKGNLSVQADTTILLSILRNLLNNAVQHGTSGTEIWLESEEGASSTALHIIDTGPGIKNEIQNKLFDPGFTSRSDGSGYGLYFSKKMAERMGGNLVYQPLERSGACFVLTLPSTKN